MIELLVGLGLLTTLLLAPVIWLLVSVFREEAALRAVHDRALASPVRYRATVATAYGMQGQGWVFDLQVEGAAGVFRARVRQMVPKWVAAGLVPGRGVVVALDPTNSAEAVFDLAAMGFAV